MTRKKTTAIFIIAFLSGMFLTQPITSFLGIPPLNDIFVNIFGENNPLVIIFGLVFISLIVYKIFKNKK